MMSIPALNHDRRMRNKAGMAGRGSRHDGQAMHSIIVPVLKGLEAAFVSAAVQGHEAVGELVNGSAGLAGLDAFSVHGGQNRNG